jgi:calcineurin-like phosphoesterase family protein
MKHRKILVAVLFSLGAVAIAALGRSAAANAAADPVIAAAGDIACDSRPSIASPDPDDRGSGVCHMAATAKLVAAMHPDAVLTLGDEQYADGSLEQFTAGYDKTWGQFKPVTHPAPGNHEYGTRGAAGYYAYFGQAAGDPSRGYYSFDLGSWHLIALNANCKAIGGCGADSSEVQWLKHDLATHHAACTLAFWHQPRFSSAMHHSDPAYDAFWRALYAAHADLVLNGHDHDYERFAPQTPDAAPDAKLGITEFVVGTGGRSHYQIGQIEPNSQARTSATYGVLRLALHPHSFDWKFVPEPGSPFSDAGSQPCHG